MMEGFGGLEGNSASAEVLRGNQYLWAWAGASDPYIAQCRSVCRANHKKVLVFYGSKTNIAERYVLRPWKASW